MRSALDKNQFLVRPSEQINKPQRIMPELGRRIASDIVIDALAGQASVSRDQIDAHSIIDKLGLDSNAMRQSQHRIVRAIESLGFRTSFPLDAFSDARTVGDLIKVVLTFTDSGGRR
jgi:acyl carrier protein